MFRFFNRSVIKPSSEIIKFLENLISVLPDKYSFLHDQINLNFFLGLEKNRINNRKFSFLLNSNLQEKYVNKKVADYFILENIQVWDNSMKNFVCINISIVRGLIVSIELPSIKFNNYDFSKHDISQLSEKCFNNEDKAELLKIIGKLNKDQLSKLDIDDTFKIEIPEGVFYTIKILGDGDYLAVDSKGTVYELLHDPYIVKKKASNIQELLQ